MDKIIVNSNFNPGTVAPEREDFSLLTDRFGRRHDYLRISLTERCNLRCTYCMPSAGVTLSPNDSLLTTEEIISLARTFVSHGVRKIRLTGGEPLVRRDVTDIVARLRSLPGVESVGITTNGILLNRKLPQLIEAGLTHVNVSLDTLVKDRFESLTRRKGLNTVLRAIEAAVDTPTLSVKVNNVVMKGTNDEELSDFVAMTKNVPLDVRFIEWMPFDKNAWNDTQFMSRGEMLEVLRADGVELQRVSDAPNDTTKWYRPEGGSVGRVGFITSMSDHFCGSCNRVRLTADGKLKACLFGNGEFDLRGPLRSGDESMLSRAIGSAVQGKHFKLGGHEDMYAISVSENRPMILIGG